MTDYAFEVMKQFPQSFINGNNELILIPKNKFVRLPTRCKYTHRFKV